MAKNIRLTNSTQTAIVDDEDFEYINQYEWFELNGHAATIIDGQMVYMEYMVMERERGSNA